MRGKSAHRSAFGHPAGNRSFSIWRDNRRSAKRQSRTTAVASTDCWFRLAWNQHKFFSTYWQIARRFRFDLSIRHSHQRHRLAGERPRIEVALAEAPEPAPGTLLELLLLESDLRRNVGDTPLAAEYHQRTGPRRGVEDNPSGVSRRPTKWSGGPQHHRLTPSPVQPAGQDAEEQQNDRCRLGDGVGRFKCRDTDSQAIGFIPHGDAELARRKETARIHCYVSDINLAWQASRRNSIKVNSSAV